MQPGRVASYKLLSPRVQYTEGSLGTTKLAIAHVLYCTLEPGARFSLSTLEKGAGGTLMGEGDKGTSFTPDG